MLWASLPFQLWKPGQAQESPEAEGLLPLGYKLPVELLAYAEQIATAKRQVERRYRHVWRKLPLVEGHMLRWLVQRHPDAQHDDNRHAHGTQEERSQYRFLSSISTDMSEVLQHVVKVSNITEESTLRLRDVCLSHHQLTTD